MLSCFTFYPSMPTPEPSLPGIDRWQQTAEMVARQVLRSRRLEAQMAHDRIVNRREEAYARAACDLPDHFPACALFPAEFQFYP